VIYANSKSLYSLVAVHGSEGGSYSTWVDPETSTSLLVDLLPLDFPQWRIMIYGYSKDKIQDAKNDQNSNQAVGRLGELAINFSNDLLTTGFNR